MKLFKLLLLGGLIASGCLSAQGLTSVTVSTNLSGPVFYVDGAGYTGAQTFTWPVGSKHTVQFLLSVDPTGAPSTYQNAQGGNIRYVFSGWSDGKGLLAPAAQAVLTISADSSLTTLVANVTVNYHVQINFGTSISNTSVCAAAPADPSQLAGLVYGLVYFDGACVANTTDYFLPAGVHTLNAFPYPGWVFYGWNINGNPTATFLSTYDVEAPATLIPLFSIAKRLQLTTNPPGLNLLVDRSPVPTPAAGTSTTSGSCAPDYTRVGPLAPAGFTPLCIGQFDFLPGSKHSLAAQTPQQDQFGNYWIFGGFSNGQGQNTVYTADYNTNTPDNVVANFNPGVHASIFTNPIGLKLQIDNQNVTAPFNVIWAAGDTHQVSAPAQQTDSHGRVWVFSNWSNAGTAAQSVTVPANGLALAATYTLLAQVQVTSSPAGLTFTVDGNSCVTPCLVNKSSGQFQVTIPGSIPSGQTSRLDYASWSDGGDGLVRQVTIPQDTLVLTANYQTSYLLTMASNPANSASFKMSPGSSDGFFASGTQVSITVTPKTGYKFLHWEGDLTGAFATGTLTMIGAHAVMADLSSTPFIAPAGVQTAAGPTPDGSVGPGSVISIYGQSLAPAFQLGPSNPLSQSIGDVTVDVNGQFLPLLFVSPDQIAAQVPWEIQDGTYNLKVHVVGQPDVTGSLIVSRDAPAVFTLPANPPDQPTALALHQDGTVVTAASPARRNEQISIYATGFGPYDHNIPDGFPPAATDTYKVVDPVTVTVGSVDVKPDATVAASGMVGMTVVKIKITAALPTASTVNLTVTVNGKTSAPVSLPLQ